MSDEPCRGIFDDDYEPSEEPEQVGEYCVWCGGYGVLETYDSNDVVVATERCPKLDDPAFHPPATPVPLQTAVVSGHMPDCDGACNYGYPDGCPPF